MKYNLQNLIDTILWLDEEAGCPEAYTKAEITELAIEALESMQTGECFSCGANTFDIGEYYAVQADLWKTYGVEGMLCIGCLEKRLGRQLTAADFVDAAINKPEFGHLSERLKDRLGI